MEYLIIIISAVFVNNVVLSQFLGICPFLGVSKKVSTAFGMSLALVLVMGLATLVTYLIQNYVLINTWFGEKMDITFMQTIVFILVIAALVQMVEIILKKINPTLYQALGIFLPLITTNCAVLGAALLVVTKEFSAKGVESHMMNLGESVVYSMSLAIGFGIAIILFAGMREQLELSNVPKSLKGTPIALITAGLLALAFMGFQGIV
ncbi:MAG: RnfABCDGE type electron transport complex subunit A [Bacteroidales bacterium]|jgi:electron transport complex protein RnfA|nr:RnfABCDGE type electron transport complex subunit A [Bacteroidales bacterium]MBQ1882380.1 RnfABCDGE type electron transport complex subunit A [Bacteroidales bacterium]MBQ2483515.1 RnfABCDGE type electron transport complex subunit A [Bacteroidales bacterium]MBQ2492588.1 RnfABCDGE type electron transport complex subunit A [Bacteroidales bacterium]